MSGNIDLQKKISQIGNYLSYLTVMYWFNWCEKNRRVDRTEKGRRLILDSFSSTITYTQADVRATKAF